MRLFQPGTVSYSIGKVLASILIFLAAWPALWIGAFLHSWGAIGKGPIEQGGIKPYLLFICLLYLIPALTIWGRSKFAIYISFVLLAPSFLIASPIFPNSPLLRASFIICIPWLFFAVEILKQPSRDKGHVPSTFKDKIQAARELWSYLSRGSTRKKSDNVIVFCSSDMQYCTHACQIIRDGLADTLVLCGDEHSIDTYRQYAVEHGIPDSHISVELEVGKLEVQLAQAQAKTPNANVITLVTQPYSIVRMKLLAASLWPKETEIHCSAPSTHFPIELEGEMEMEDITQLLVEEISWLKQNAGKGTIPPHALSAEIHSAWKFLIVNGYA